MYAAKCIVVIGKIGYYENIRLGFPGSLLIQVIPESLAGNFLCTL
jgi:hypothetical protein